MLAEVGALLVGLALLTTLYAALATLWSIRRADERWAASGRNALLATLALLVGATALLLIAFLTNQFQIRYVAAHSARALPLILKISALWGGQEGSLLVWCVLQAACAALVANRPSARTLAPWASVFLAITTAFFTGVTLALSNPFTQAAAAPLDGLGLNPLLRHAGMVFHPPALYVGYVGLSVPWALALAALATGRVEDWPSASRRWSLVSWLFLGIGLLLGARWAYDVLGWGGYWGWDPVENAGLMPWLAATALLHSTAMQDRRDGFRTWNMLLAVLAYALVLFGTFTTRSGLIESVHAFSQSALGAYFAGFIGLTLLSSAALIVWRARRDPTSLADPHPWEKLLSREGAFFLTLVLLLAITASVLIGTVLPTLTQALALGRFEAGADWFDRVTGPQWAALVLLMGVCPVVGGAAASLRRMRGRAAMAVGGAVVVAALAALAGFTQPASLAAFAIIGLATASTLAEVAHDTAARRRAADEGAWQALWTIAQRNRRRYGGYLVHIGVILVALGVVGTRAYAIEDEFVMTVGAPVSFGQYTLVTEQLGRELGDDRLVTRASVRVYQDQRSLGILEPQVEQHADYNQSVATPAIRHRLGEDLYLVLAGWTTDSVTIKAYINPLASFLWLGGLVLLAGGAFAAWPSAQPAWAHAPASRRRKLSTTLAAGGLALGLLAAIVMLWGGALGASPRSSQRLQPGEPAADFHLELLDGSQLALADLRGQVTVINFWATWCASCEDELPELQEVWTEYQARGFTLIGIAFEEERARVERVAEQFGLTYPLGLDGDDQIAAAYGVTGVPETYIIDTQGRVAAVHVGPITAEQLRAELEPLW